MFLASKSSMKKVLAAQFNLRTFHNYDSRGQGGNGKLKNVFSLIKGMVQKFRKRAKILKIQQVQIHSFPVFLVKICAKRGSIL